jgi:hypothetical protein
LGTGLENTPQRADRGQEKEKLLDQLLPFGYMLANPYHQPRHFRLILPRSGIRYRVSFVRIINVGIANLGIKKMTI